MQWSTILAPNQDAAEWLLQTMYGKKATAVRQMQPIPQRRTFVDVQQRNVQKGDRKWQKVYVLYLRMEEGYKDIELDVVMTKIDAEAAAILKARYFGRTVEVVVEKRLIGANPVVFVASRVVDLFVFEYELDGER